MRVAALVLAAGASSRFGSQKLLAPLSGRPVLQHVLDTLAGAGLAGVVVVLGDEAAAIGTGIAWHNERRVVNPRPQDGLSSSLRIGLDGVVELVPEAEAALIVLGDQPALRADVVQTVLQAADGDPSRPIVRTRYKGDAAPNPVLVRRAAWALAAGLSGDRGLGPLLRERPDLVIAVDVDGANPDIDTPADLRAAAEGMP